jgi:putative holliday junction resolvase
MHSFLRASPCAADLLLPGPSFPGVILAIDYGRKRLGLALSDEHGMTSRPFATWTRINRRRDLTRLRELARQHGVCRIVIGLPVHLDGTASEMSAETRAFAARVEKALGVPVEMMDERLSSWEAGQTLTARKSPPAPHRAHGQHVASKRRTHLDDVAAAVILRDYLNRARTPAGTRA